MTFSPENSVAPRPWPNRRIAFLSPRGSKHGNHRDRQPALITGVRHEQAEMLMMVDAFHGEGAESYQSIRRKLRASSTPAGMARSTHAGEDR